MKHKSFTVGALVGLLLAVWAVPGLTLTLAKTSLEKLTTTSTIIVHGTVDTQESRWRDARQDFIVTDLTIHVDQFLKGEETVRNTEQVVVQLIGGQIGEIGHHLPGQPIFEKGEEVVLFLQEYNGAYLIHSIAHGCFRVFSNAEREKQVVNDLGNIHLIDPETQEEVDPAEAMMMFDMDAFFSKIDDIMAQNEK